MKELGSGESGAQQQTTTALRSAGESYAASGQWQQAIDCYERLLEMCPGDVSTRLQLSYTHSLAGGYRAGLEYTRSAFALAGDKRLSDETATELIARLRTFNLTPDMLDCIESLRPVSKMSIPVLLKCAAQLSYVNLPERALVLLDEARRADPDYPVSLLARGQVLMYCGRFDEARLDIDRALKRAPEIAQGYWLRASLPGKRVGHNQIDSIRRLLNRPGQRPGDTALLGYALHKELDAIGDYAGAWEALELACRAKRSSIAYRDADSRALFDALRLMPTLPPHKNPGAGPMPVFIVGMHRSGTTLLEQLLDGAPFVRGIGELYDFTSAMRWATDHHCRGVIDQEVIARAPKSDFVDAGHRYVEGLRWRLSGEPVFTDKLPSNFLNLGFIAAALPQAKILHMVRDPVETCFSNLRELFSEANPYSYVQEELADFYNEYRGLMHHWHGALPGRILDVEYARLIREPDATMREVCAFCGIDYHPEMLDIERRTRAVVTASAVQVRSGIAVHEQPKWKPYERYLQPLATRLRQ